MQENNNQNANELELSELLQIRRDKLTALCEGGANPFEITKYDVTALSQDAIKEFEAKESTLAEGEELVIEGYRAAIADKDSITILAQDKKIEASLALSERQRKILLAGGLLNYTKQEA